VAAVPSGTNWIHGAPGTHWIGSWVDLRFGSDAVEKRKIFHCRESNRCLIARSPFFLFFNWYLGVESNWIHSALRPPIGLLCQPHGDYDDGEIGGMIGRGNRSTGKKPAPVPLCPPQTPRSSSLYRVSYPDSALRIAVVVNLQ
jgi:hypothetical protein